MVSKLLPNMLVGVPDSGLLVEGLEGFGLWLFSFCEKNKQTLDERESERERVEVPFGD